MLIEPEDDDPDHVLAAELPIVRALLRQCGISPGDVSMVYEDAILGFIVNVVKASIDEASYSQIFEATNRRGHLVVFAQEQVEIDYWTYALERTATAEALVGRIWN